MMNNQWISLGEYSSKYRISISTLRRRIRTGQIPFSFKMGKYFLEDQNPVDLRKSKKETEIVSHKNDLNAGSLKKELGLAKKQKDHSLSAKPLKDPSFMLPQETLFLKKVMDSQKELYEHLEKKELKMDEQQNRIVELNTLVALLEKENKELKSLLYQEEEMEEWLEMKNN